MTAPKPDPLADQMMEWGLPYEYDSAAQLLSALPRIESEYVLVVANVQHHDGLRVRTFGGWWTMPEAEECAAKLRRRRKVTVLSATVIPGRLT